MYLCVFFVFIYSVESSCFFSYITCRIEIKCYLLTYLFNWYLLTYVPSKWQISWPVRINKYSRSLIIGQTWQSGSDGITTVAPLLNWSVLEDGTHTTTLSENIFMSWNLIKCSVFPRVSFVISPTRKLPWKVVVNAAQNSLASYTEWQNARIIFKILANNKLVIGNLISLLGLDLLKHSAFLVWRFLATSSTLFNLQKSLFLQRTISQLNMQNSVYSCKLNSKKSQL